MKKKIVIIGGGISGLTAGIFALLNGYDATILEKNDDVGGLCTGWTRKGWYIDGCIHWLTGTKKEYDTYKNWKTLGAFNKDEDLIFLPSWGSFEYQGTTVTFWSDLKRAEKEWLAISPIDKKPIKWFFKCVRKLGSFEVPAEAPIPLFRFRSYFLFIIRMIKTFPHYLLSTKMTCEGFAKKFESKALQNALIKAQPGDGNLYSMAFSYATVASGNGGLIKGGSRLMTRRMGDKFISLGGDLRLNSPVKQIVVENKKVSKVILEDNSEVTGDYFISCCESDYTCHTLLENKYVNKKLEKRFKDMDIIQNTPKK